LNAEAGRSATGFAAYAARACASQGNVPAASNPRTLRLYRSSNAVSNSHRRPRFTVNFFETFQSSWKNTPQDVDCSEYDAGRQIPPLVGNPSKSAATDCPNPAGAAGEFTFGPRVHAVSKENCDVTLFPYSRRFSRYDRNSVPIFMKCEPCDFDNVALTLCVSFGRHSPPPAVPWYPVRSIRGNFRTSSEVRPFNDAGSPRLVR